MTLGVVALLALLALVVIGPGAVRRRHRATGVLGSPEQVWSELRATVLDVGARWPADRSPREVGSALLELLGDPGAAAAERPRTGPDAAPDAAAALERIVDRVERSRYALAGSRSATAESVVAEHPVGTTGATDTPLAHDARQVIAAIEAGATPRARRRAHWAPRSLWRR